MDTADVLESGDDVAERSGGNVVGMDGGRGSVLILVPEATCLVPENSVRRSQSGTDDGETRVALFEPRFMSGG